MIIGHDSSKIDKLKKELTKSFSMKNLGSVKHILGMKISRDRNNRKLWLSQESYIEKVLERFNMSKGKTVCSPLAGHLKLSSKQCPTSEKYMKEMSIVPYVSTIDSLMYVMVCTMPDSPTQLELLAGFLLIMGRSIGK